jgi:hypothetical protein
VEVSMRVHGGSFLLGIATAALVPVLTRFLRPMAVQLATAGMSAFDDARRVAAEQFEVIQDIAAEARAKREEREEPREAKTDAERRSNGRSRVLKGRRRAPDQASQGDTKTADDSA